MRNHRLFWWVYFSFLGIFVFANFFIPQRLPRRGKQSSMLSTGEHLSVSSASFKPLIIPNLGQYPPEVLFVAQQGSLTLWFTQNAVWFSLVYRNPQETEQEEQPGKFPPLVPQSKVFNWKISFMEHNPQSYLVADAPLSPRFNFFQGADPARWITEVPAYSRLVYRELYPGLDLEIDFDIEGLQWAFGGSAEKKPADLSKPHLRVEGFEVVQVEGKRLVLKMPDGELKLPLPEAKQGLRISWQTQEGEPQQTEISAVGEGMGWDATKLRVASLWDSSKESSLSRAALAQDNLAELVFSTYLGGSGEEIAYDVAVDAEGYVYVVGSTTSPNFPGVSGGYDPQHNGNQDVFVSKLFPDASNLVYSTYVGGTSLDRGYALAVTDAGEAIIGGVTTSNDFPRTQGAIGGNGDGFVLRLSAQGNQLQFSRLMGGGQSDAVNDLVIDDSERIYVTGETLSGEFPIGYGRLGGKDCFVGKSSSGGEAFQSVGLLSGSGDDVCYGIDVYQGEKVTVAGSTTSQNFPITQGAFSTQYNGGEADGFIVSMDMSAYSASLTYSSYLGGNGWDEVLDIKNQGGFSFLTGFTASTNFPSISAYDPTFGGVFDAFVVKFQPTSGLAFSTYLGGSALDIGRAIAVTNSGETLVSGNTSSIDFPTTSIDFPTTSSALFRVFQGGEDVFVTKLGSGGNELLYGTYFGGTGNERGYGIALGGDPRPHVVGYTDSDSLLLSDYAVDQTFQIGEAFVLKLALGFFPTPTPSKSPSPSPSSTATPLPTSTKTPLPTKTLTPTRTATPTRTLTPTRTERPTMTMVPTSAITPFQGDFRVYIPWINMAEATP